MVKDGSRLRPVMVSRLQYEDSPRDLLDRSLWPATAVDDLSPADRVFGWVAPERSADTPAHRAQLRITDLVCPAVTKRSVRKLSGLTLPPLATPKPGQGRFYLGDRNQNGVPRPLGKDVRRADMFTDDRTLRGRKVYPHQAWLTDLDDETLINRLRYTPPSTNGEARKERDSQNATLHSWVKGDQEFTFTCRFQDLTEAELGALLWLLDPEKLGRDGAAGHLRLGRGKTVRVRVGAG